VGVILSDERSEESRDPYSCSRCSAGQEYGFPTRIGVLRLAALAQDDRQKNRSFDLCVQNDISNPSSSSNLFQKLHQFRRQWGAEGKGLPASGMCELDGCRMQEVATEGEHAGHLPSFGLTCAARRSFD